MFALTPQTEEKYKKIDEEFDKMMQSYRLAVSSGVEDAPVVHGVALPSAASDLRGCVLSRAGLLVIPEEPLTVALIRL